MIEFIGPLYNWLQNSQITTWYTVISFRLDTPREVVWYSTELSIASESYVTTDGQSASLSLNKASTWGLLPDFYCCKAIAVLLIWGALSDERTGLSFITVAGPRQRSHSRVRVPWYSRPYVTASDSRLPFSPPPTTRRATVEVFDPSSLYSLGSSHGTENISVA
jgi:hypothetical protein